MRPVKRLREVFRALTGARLPSRPKRRYDLITEAMTRPFGGGGGRGRVRDGGVEDRDRDRPKD
jgi:hypothetical protein